MKHRHEIGCPTAAKLLSSLVLCFMLSVSTAAFGETLPNNEAIEKNKSIFQRAKASVSSMLEQFSGSWIENGGKGSRGVSGNAKDLLQDLEQVSGKNISLTVPAKTRGIGQSNLPPQKPEDSGANVDTERGGEGDAPKGGDTGRPPVGGTASTPPYWLPYCFLVDPAHDAAAVNAGIKMIADTYASCGIAIKPYAFTIQPNYPQQPGELSTLARQACNTNTAFGVRGAVQLMVANPQLPIEMCDQDDAVGCSTLCERISVSMVAPGGPGITQLHESLHSNCCGRLCVDNGEGTGEPAGPELELSAQVDFMNLPVTGIKVMQAETDTNPEQGDNDYQVPDATCQTLQQGAAPNTFHRHDPNKQEYYIAATDPSVMKQLDGRSLFPPQPQTPPDEEHEKGATEEKGSEEGSGGGNQFTELNDGKGESESGTGKDLDIEGIIASVTKGDPRHQQKLGADGKVINDQGRLGGPSNSEVRYTQKITVAPSGSGKQWPRVGFDDEAPKRQVSGRGPASTSNSGDSYVSAISSPSSGGVGDSVADALVSGLNDASSRGFFNNIGSSEAEPKPERKSGATLRRSSGVGKRDSDSGLSRRSDVVISTRESKDFTAPEAQPIPGVY